MYYFWVLIASVVTVMLGSFISIGYDNYKKGRKITNTVIIKRKVYRFYGLQGFTYESKEVDFSVYFDNPEFCDWFIYDYKYYRKGVEI